MPPSQPPVPTPPARGWLDRLRQTRRENLVALFWEMVRFGWVGVLAYGPCLVINYVLHRSFTFKSEKQHSQAGPRFLAIQLGGLGVNSGVLWFGVDHMRWPYLPAQVSVVVILALLSYLGQKLWSF